MNTYILRVAFKNTTLVEVLSVFQDYDYLCYVCEKMDSQNPHMHAVVSHRQSDRHLRRKLRDLGLKGNRDYSLKLAKEAYPIEALSYLHKAGTPICINLPEEVSQEVQEHAQKMLDRKSKNTNKLAKLIDYVGELPTFDRHDREGARYYICQKIINYYLEHELIVRKFDILAYTDTIYLKLTGRIESYVLQILG